MGTTSIRGQDLRKLRIARGITLQTAAERAGLSKTTLSVLERGQRPLRLDDQVKILRVLID